MRHRSKRELTPLTRATLICRTRDAKSDRHEGRGDPNHKTRLPVSSIAACPQFYSGQWPVGSILPGEQNIFFGKKLHSVPDKEQRRCPDSYNLAIERETTISTTHGGGDIALGKCVSTCEYLGFYPQTFVGVPYFTV